MRIVKRVSFIHLNSRTRPPALGSYYGWSATGGKQSSSDQTVGFNMKNGAEYYLGITEMLQAMDSNVDPCSDFCKYTHLLLLLFTCVFY